MIIWKELDLYYEPRNVCVSEINFPEREPEMTEFESAFLCALIKERRPKKIVEIGVAGGGTTAIILKCLQLIGMDNQTEIFSVDLSVDFYRHNGEKTGYLANSILKDGNFNHRFILGKYLPEVIEEIGKDIDFVVLDTCHIMPGEILDFLVVFPYLKNDACVVLHDIACHHYYSNPMGFPTQMVFCSTIADKILMKDLNREGNYPNIGALVMNEASKDSIFNLLNAMMVTWQEDFSADPFKVYQQFYSQTYGDDFARFFEMVCRYQKKTAPKLIQNRNYYKKIRRVCLFLYSLFGGKK